MGPRDRQQQQDGVEPHERRRRLGRAAHPRGRAGAQRNGSQACRHRHRLQRPQPAAEPDQRERVGAEREQRPVGRMLEGPADEREDGIDGRFRGDVRIGVQAVQDPQARERQVAEHVLGDQRRTQQQQRVGRQDADGDSAPGQRSRRAQRSRVAGAKQECPQLESTPADVQSQPRKRPRQPAGPAAAAGRYELAGAAGGPSHDGKNTYRYGQQAHQPDRVTRSCAACAPGCENALIAVQGCGGR